MENIKKVDLLIGIPCSGKSTYRNKNYNSENTFVISRDDIKLDLIDEYGIGYQDMYKKPKPTDPVNHPLYGVKTETGEWSKVKEMNQELVDRFEARKLESLSALSNGKRIVFDLTNLTVSERAPVIEMFKDIEGVQINAVNFKCEGNIELIKRLNQKRGEETNNVIPEFIIDGMAEKIEYATKNEGFNSVTMIDGLSALKPKKAKQRRRKF